jgi:hypothetical protein
MCFHVHTSNLNLKTLCHTSKQGGAPQVLEECERALFVADRENGRVHRFSLINRAYEGAPRARAARQRPGPQRSGLQSSGFRGSLPAASKVPGRGNRR